MPFKLLAAIAAFIMVMEPAPAHAFVFTVTLAFIGGFLAGLGAITPLIGLGGIAVVNAGFAVGAFLASGFGSLLVSIGLSAAQYFLTPKPKAPTIESARINVRINEPPRWIHAGRSRAGGAVLFGEYDQDGNFWMVLVHGDSPLLATQMVLLDEIPVTINENNEVTTAEFTLTQTVGGAPVFKIWTTTYTPDDPIPPEVTDFKTAFPEWTDDHLLVGTTYSVVRIASMSAENRYKVMTWRGVMGLGEPSVSIVGDWSYIYDPREVGHDIEDESTWSSSRNPELIWAWFRTHPWGRKKPMASINWDEVATQADICDETVLDKDENEIVRYLCGTSIPDNKERHVAETEILLSADAMIMHDEVGKAYARVGYYEAPTLALSKNRDILSMSSREANDGELETDGVIVKYIEPDFFYVVQPAAAWVNPLFYQEGRTPNYLTVEVLACQSHNQAMRLAKALGLRTQSAYRLGPICGLRGIIARRERIVDLIYDDAYTGDHEISTPVELDEFGISTSFGLVPVDENRWTLLEGEEKDRPVKADPIEYDDSLPLATNVVLAAVPLTGSIGAGVRIEATFDPSPRIDWRYEFQYRRSGDLIWRPMAVLMEDQLAYSDTIIDGETYEVQFRTLAFLGRASDWKDPPLEIVAVADPVAPTETVTLSETSAAPHLGHAPLTLVLPNDTKRVTVGIYKVATGGALDTSNPSQEVAILATGGAPTSLTYVEGDGTTATLTVNGTFTGGITSWSGANWTGVGDKAVHTPGATTHLTQAITLANGDEVRVAGTVSDRTAGSTGIVLSGSTPVTGGTVSANGRYQRTITANATTTGIGLNPGSVFDGAWDDVVAFVETGAHAGQGVWDYYAVPRNGSGVEGPPSSPLTITVD